MIIMLGEIIMINDKLAFYLFVEFIYHKTFVKCWDTIKYTS